jgi:hypothetical protein
MPTLRPRTAISGLPSLQEATSSAPLASGTGFR